MFLKKFKCSSIFSVVITILISVNIYGRMNIEIHINYTIGHPFRLRYIPNLDLYINETSQF